MFHKFTSNVFCYYIPNKKKSQSIKINYIYDNWVYSYYKYSKTNKVKVKIGRKIYEKIQKGKVPEEKTNRN